ncbi:MAG: DsbE family thiol:disulfide interchange protein [Burkholderiaceae bacterium]
MRVIKYLLPLAIFAGIFVFLFKGLSKDPSQIPSPLIDKPAPAFTLPLLGSEGEFSPADLKGKVWLLNIWGSWCAACLIEHPVFLDAAANKSLLMVGLAWKDDPQASVRWLRRHGNPFEIVISDVPGRSAIDYGVYGAPESFLIDKQGIIRYKKVGPFSTEEFNNELLPLAARLASE